MLNGTRTHLRAGETGYGTTCPSCQGPKGRTARSCFKCGRKTSAIKHRRFTATSKWCPDCKRDIPLDGFNLKRGEPSGRQEICRPCQSERGKAWRLANPELSRQRQAASRHRNRDYYRDHALRSRHGITLEQKAAMYADQDGRCAICTKPFASLHLDHCHRTGTIRALLCSNCNRGIGHLQDDPAILRASAEYIERHSC